MEMAWHLSQVSAPAKLRGVRQHGQEVEGLGGWQTKSKSLCLCELPYPPEQ